MPARVHIDLLGHLPVLKTCKLEPWTPVEVGGDGVASRPNSSLRQSIRRYTSEPVPEWMLERILLAATAAASAHNRQPWRFVVVQEQAIKDQIAEAMAERLREDRSADGDSAQLIDADIAKSRTRLREAPVLIFVFMTVEDMDRYPDGRRGDAERTMAVQSTAMATQNLLNSASEEQLGACIMCAPLFCADIVSSALGVPIGWQAQALVTVGWPNIRGAVRARHPIDKVVWKLRTAE